MIFRELEEGQRKVRDMAGLEHGVVSLVATTLYGLPDLLHHFQVLYPSIHFHLSQCSLAEMPQQLETGERDFCLTSTPLIKPGIQWEPLRPQEILLIVPDTHRLAGRESVPLREVAYEAVVIEKVGVGIRDLMDDFCQQAGFIPRISYEINEPAALYEFVKAGLGVIFAPASMKRQISGQALTALHLTNPTCHCTFGIAWHQKHYLSQAAHAFREFIVEHSNGLVLPTLPIH